MFHDEREELDLEDLTADVGSSEILRSKVGRAMRNIKRGKGAENGVMIKMLRAAGDMVVRSITEIPNKIYNSGQLQNKFTTVFIAIPKVSGIIESQTQNKHYEPDNKNYTGSNTQEITRKSK